MSDEAGVERWAPAATGAQRWAGGSSACETPDMAEEEELSGGNTTVVVRVGDTVRRSVGHWTPAVHNLLDHLESVGFAGSPRVLGIDESDREILAFVPGEVGTLSVTDPLPAWFRTPEACWAIGRWIRDFQSAQVGLRLDPATPWRRAAGAALGPGQVLVHHDVSSYNTVRRTGGSLVVLDWDFVRPGDPLEDVAWAAWRWAPLMVGSWWHAEYGIGSEEDVRQRQRRNLAALMDGYGLSVRQRPMLWEAIGEQMIRHASDLEDLAVADLAFADLIERGYARRARADAAWWLGPRWSCDHGPSPAPVSGPR
ncbi:phosphotransferase [Leekyejoonella antrihumi]|uniref:Aminoglycoside phosphotransferase family protein n=1 Tax=Leekyejoonella antrihumi TaxID=1660198 RepID=A0A563E6W2_9MICO|nr:phosphotransferase [Leekyejoonella antrihumi]TWP38270.1 aminoglycoside phosphotransferase family protein [Leekyejoonella antrihumi]